MKRLLLSMLTLTFVTGSLFAQTRYVDEVYTDEVIDIVQDIPYASNYTVLYGDIDPTTDGNQFKLDTLLADFYYPPYEEEVGLRPIVFVLHSGSFLPRYINNSAVGYKDDSATVEICKRFARRGYVVASLTYRMGWNPASPDEDVRRSTIINAAYKGVQDLSAAIRFIKDEAVLLGNFNAIDTTKMVLGGQGTGSYITSAFASLDNQEEIKIDKFRNTDGSVMVNDTVWGDRFGMGGFPGYNMENWAGYTTEAHVAFQIGGALGDSSWIDAGEMPMIWAHSVLDPFAPYKTGIVSVPGTTLQVVEATGGYDAIKSSSSQGNNKPYEGKVMDGYTHAIHAYNLDEDNKSMDGLYPIHGMANASGPYEWYDTNTIKMLPLPPTTIASILGGIRLSNPMHSKTKAMTYLDSVVGYIAPRVAVSLGLVDAVGINEINLGSNVAIGPVPAKNELFIYNNWDNSELQSIEIRNLNGQVVLTQKINSKKSKLNLNLPTGLYVMQMQFNNGVGTKKFIVQ